MEEQVKKADSFLERHVGINYKEFIIKYDGGLLRRKNNEGKVLFYLSALEDLESRGFNLEDFLQRVKENTLPFIVPLEHSVINSKIKNTLKKSSSARNKNFDLTTLVSKELVREMKKGRMKGKVLTGKKYYDAESGIIYDILLNAESFENLNKINLKEAPAVPYFGYGTVEYPKKYFLSLNKEFPEIKKIFRGSKRNNPVLFKLGKTNYGKKTFTIGSYMSIEEK